MDFYSQTKNKMIQKKELTQMIRHLALKSGFHKVGIAPAIHLDHFEFLNKWLAENFHGHMCWMGKNSDKRKDISKYFLDARSVVIVAQNYYTDFHYQNSVDTGKISRYAWGCDYHKIIKKKLKHIFKTLQSNLPGIDGRIFIDTAPVQEKLWAVQAGIGWQGKHTNIISREYGSWIFLGGIVLNIELEYDTKAVDHCGTCTACIDACPTAALKPYVLDARRCISYLTIENKQDELPVEFRNKMEKWIFGCDICQEVCPWNRKPIPTDDFHYVPGSENIAPNLNELAKISEADFRKRFTGTPVLRAKYKYFVRNVKAALDNKNG